MISRFREDRVWDVRQVREETDIDQLVLTGWEPIGCTQGAGTSSTYFVFRKRVPRVQVENDAKLRAEDG